MKRSFLIWSPAIGACLLSPAPAVNARGWHNLREGARHKVRDSRPKSAFTVPEVDASPAVSTMALLLDSVAHLASRRREEDPA